MGFIAPPPVIPVSAIIEPAPHIQWIPLAGGKSIIFNGQVFFTGYQFMPGIGESEDRFQVVCRLVSQVEACRTMVDDARREIIKLSH